MTLTDAEARRDIREKVGDTLFVDAGAGSGKTTELVERLVTSVLIDGVPLADTAVLTFTEKAGAELRDRLRAELEKRYRLAADDLRPIVRTALDDLDGAAIGTLHSFAQRILAAFPIQAGMPPLVEVLDEVGSSVAFDRRWSVMWRELLDDDALAEPLLLALANGIKPDHLRSLARAFGSDWDLIDSRVLSEAEAPFLAPDAGPLIRLAESVGELHAICTKPSDRLAASVDMIASFADRMRIATAPAERFALAAAVNRSGDPSRVGRGRIGAAGNWRGQIDHVRAQVVEFCAAAEQLGRDLADALLRPIARAIAVRVRADAKQRVASGELEFHDLLVASRDLLRHSSEAREALQHTYQRILLDEFQDTDPIQIELAVRIVGGAMAEAEDWHEIAVPEGSLFVVGDPKQSIYRFRRASIETYLDAGKYLGRHVSLTTNFRTISPVLDWVNRVFDRIIVEDEGKQPGYEALAPHRDDVVSHIGPAVTVLGADPHEKGTKVDVLRAAEAAGAAAVITTALAEGWTVQDRDTKQWRPVRAGDIAILLPARTSLRFLEVALDEAGVPYRTESSSLVYQADEIRALMAVARAIADPSDELACVQALRTTLFACGDDDLFRYWQGGGRFAVNMSVHDDLVGTPAGAAMDYLNGLFRRSRWLSPAELLSKLAIDRRVLEVASAVEPSSRARDQWARVRFVIDQARAWSDVQHGGLREYVVWASHQAQDAARVAEALLPESDLDVVRVMTVHAAKGLEFGMVVLSGMTSQPKNETGVRLLWQKGGYAVKIGGSVETNDFADAAPIDEQMDDAERRRLLYVAATRARDHLVVSLHRAEGGVATAAKLFVDAGAMDVPGVVRFEGAGEVMPSIRPPEPTTEGLEYDEWRERIDGARARSKAPSARTASGLEGTEPEVQWDLTAAGNPAQAERIAGDAKGVRDAELPPWLKGRYGNLIGRAVHGALQVANGDAARVGAAVASQALAEGIPDLEDTVASYVRSALATPLVITAFERQHWSEMYVGAVEHDGLVIEGFIDLVFRDMSGGLVILDFKTDTVPDAEALAERATYYAPQLKAYARALEAATGEAAEAWLVFLGSGGREGNTVQVVGVTVTPASSSAPTPYSTPAQLSVFRFRIDDPDPEVVLYGCVAASEAEAALATRGAGFREFVLFDQFPLAPDETMEAASNRIRANPLLGPQWLRIGDVIAIATQRLRTGRFWQMDTYAAAFGHDPYRSPFVQTMLEADGSLHVEVGGVTVEDLQPMRSRLLEMLGWIDLSADEEADPQLVRQLPLPHRTFEPGWNAAMVAEAVLQTLVLGFGLTESDFFSFGEQPDPPYRDIAGLEVVRDGPMFRIAPDRRNVKDGHA
ncbi:UvrD-helicase domain-containing protein [Microbacterium foliorum]|uniref:UvrD-helicase domain-containing protein n=1 Tax=Microbacterium foliorum TaxID=104336 RepID=UPI003735CC45